MKVGLALALKPEDENVTSCQHGGPKAGEGQGLLRKLDVTKGTFQGRVATAQIGWWAGAS